MSTPTIEQVGIDRLIPYANNARTHSDAQVAQIAASIKEFGFNNPVLIDPANTIIAGHGRVMAARKLGLATVPCVRLGHLTANQVKAYVLADNKLALNAGWDEELLKIELVGLRDNGVDLGLAGFGAPELEQLLAEFNAGEADMPELSDADKVPFQQKTFTLHNEQSEEVDDAIAKAKEMGHGESAVNENSNGNALAFICQSFNRNFE